MTASIHISRDGATWGPYPPEEIDNLIASGYFVGTDLAWHEGLPEWQPLETLPRFSAQCRAAAPIAEAGAQNRLLFGPSESKRPLPLLSSQPQVNWRRGMLITGVSTFLLGLLLVFASSELGGFMCVAGLMIMLVSRLSAGGSGGWGSGGCSSGGCSGGCGGGGGGGCGGGD